LAHNWQRIKTVVSTSTKDFGCYFKHPAFLPSFAGTLLYLTILSFAGQIVTYLVSSGYSSMHIGIAQTLSVAFEVLATWVAPWLMGKIGPIRSSLWLIYWQMIFLEAGMVIFWAYAKDQPIILAAGLVGGMILSCLGLRGFDLSVQLIVQDMSFPLSSCRHWAYYLICIYLSSPRRLKWQIAAHSSLSKLPGKMHSSSAPTSLPLSFYTQSSSGGPAS
jgi:Ferroportin1 (FPN1)